MNWGNPLDWVTGGLNFVGGLLEDDPEPPFNILEYLSQTDENDPRARFISPRDRDFNSQRGLATYGAGLAGNLQANRPSAGGARMRIPGLGFDIGGFQSPRQSLQSDFSTRDANGNINTNAFNLQDFLMNLITPQDTYGQERRTGRAGRVAGFGDILKDDPRMPGIPDHIRAQMGGRQAEQALYDELAAERDSKGLRPKLKAKARMRQPGGKNRA